MEEKIITDSCQTSIGVKSLLRNTLCKITTIFLLSFLSAFLYSQLAGRSLTEMAFLEGDSIEYDGIAVNFLNGYGLSSYGVMPQAWLVNSDKPTLQMHREPFYPLFLALIYYTFGHSLLPAMIAQFIIYGFISYIVYLTGKIVFDEKVALWGSLLLSVHPNMALTFSKIGQEALAIFFSVLSIFLLLLSSIRANRSHLYLIFSSIFMALSALTRSILLLFPLVIIFYFLSVVKKKEAFLRCAVFCFVFASITVLWPIRNYKVMGYFSFTSNLGEILYVRTAFIGEKQNKITLFDPTAKNISLDLNRSYAKMVAKYKSLYFEHKNEVVVSKALLREALEKISSYPAEYIIGGLPPFQRMILDNNSQLFISLSFAEALNSRAYFIIFFKIILRLIYSLPYLLTVLAFILLRPSWNKWSLLFIFVTYSLLINSLLVGSYVRHIINIYPYIILFAVAFIMGIRKKKTAKSE